MLLYAVEMITQEGRDANFIYHQFYFCGLLSLSSHCKFQFVSAALDNPFVFLHFFSMESFSCHEDIAIKNAECFGDQQRTHVRRTMTGNRGSFNVELFTSVLSFYFSGLKSDSNFRELFKKSFRW